MNDHFHPHRNWMLALFLGLAAASAAHARIIANPDTNTLWVENGEAVETGPGTSDKYWSAGSLEIESVPGTGLVFRSVSMEKCGTSRDFPADPAYPYLVWDIAETEHVERQAYRAVGLYMPDMILGYEGPLYPGIFVFNLPLSNPAMEKGKLNCRLYLYGSQMFVKSIKMVKTPDYCIELLSPAMQQKKSIEIGDNVTFRVSMRAPAEDVTLTFWDSRGVLGPVTLNKFGRLQLKPESAGRKIWTAELKIETAPNADFKPGSFLIRATILGGGTDRPVWTSNPFPFKLTKKEIK